MTGVILCGGQSTRMGADKGLINSGAATWAQTCVIKMMTLQIPVLLSVNAEQCHFYQNIFNKNQLVADNASIEASGPLRGLLSLHLKYPLEDLFILPCDMPLMEPSVLEYLLSSYRKIKADAYVYTNDGYFEPLCGIYTADAIGNTLRMLKEGQLLKHSMKYLLEHLNTFSVPLDEEQKIYFKNFNSHADLNGM